MRNGILLPIFTPATDAKPGAHSIMTPSFKAAKAFFVHYQQEIDRAKPYGLKPVLGATLAQWWEENKDSHPRATFEGMEASVKSTMAYNAAYPNR